MRLLTILRLRFRSFFSRARVEAELDEELQYHLNRDIEQRVAAGMACEDARYAALQSLKDIEQRKEECRDARALNLLENVTHDTRYALRQLRKDPAFACTAVVVLALGIAATVAIFSFVESALIKPLPYRDQSRLVAVFESSPGAPRSWLSYLDFADWRRVNRVFSSLDAYALNGSFTLSTRTGAEQVPGTRVSASFFRTLGVTPALGRDFRPAEDSAGSVKTVVLSYAAWQKRYGGMRDILGRSVTLNGSPTVIIGVLPKAFQFAPYGGAEFWATLRPTDSCEQHRGCHNLIAVGRLKRRNLNRYRLCRYAICCTAPAARVPGHQSVFWFRKSGAAARLYRRGRSPDTSDRSQRSVCSPADRVCERNYSTSGSL